MEVLFTHCSMNGLKEITFVHVPLSLGESMCFPIVSFVSWNRRRETGEEQQALSSSWSSEKKTVSVKPPGGGGDDSAVVGFDLKKPRKNTVRVWIVRFLKRPRSPGAAVPTPFIDQTGTGSLTAALRVLWQDRLA